MKKGSSLMTAILIFCLVASIIGLVRLFSAKSPGPAAVGNSQISLFQNSLDSRPGIGVVKIYGPIFTESEGSFYGLMERGADAVVKKLDDFRKDSRVKAVILRVNSPGGSIGASQEITDAVIRLKQDGKKVFASMGDIAASGGYYVSAMADKIVANRGTITGSIGVISAGLNVAELMKKYGVKMNVIKQGENKDIFAYWRDMTPEEKKILDDLTASAYNQFVEVVSIGRNIPKNEVLAIADGRIVTGEQARELNLIDEYGGFLDAVRIAATEVGLDPENPHLITSTEVGFKKLFEFIGQESSVERSVDFMQYLMYKPLPVLYYCALPLPESYLNFAR